MVERKKLDFSDPGAYLEWLKAAETYRAPFEICWQQFWDLYRHRHPYAKDDSCYQINKVFSTVNVILSSTALEYPRITVTPKSPGVQAAAQLSEQVLNCFWRQGDFQECFKEAWKDAVVIGHGWAKTTWRFEESEYDDERREKFESDDKEADKLREGNEAVARSIAHPVDDLRLPTEDENERRTGTRVTFDEAILQRISPWDMYVDPTAKSIREIRWIAQKVRMTAEEVEQKAKPNLADGGWRTSAAKSATTDERDDLERRNPIGVKPDDCEEYVEVWEFYDVARNTMSIFADDATEYLRDPEPSPYAFGHPFIYIGNHELTEELYDMGDVEAISDLQDELNQTRTDIMNHRKRYRVKYWAREGLPTATMDGLKSAEEDCIIPVPEGEDIDEIFGVVDQIQVPADFYNQSLLISQDIDEVSGVTEFQRGVASAGGTATEAAILSSASNARSSEKLRRLERAMASVARNTLMLMQQFMTNSMTLRVAGVQSDREFSGIEESGVDYDSDRQVMWIKVNRHQIAGEFDFQIEAGSTQPNNESLRAQRAIQVTSLLTPYVSAGLVDAQALIRWSLEQLGFQNPDRFLTQQNPQQVAGQLQQAGSVANPANAPGGGGVDPAVSGLDNPLGAQREVPGAISQLEAQLNTSIG